MSTKIKDENFKAPTDINPMDCMSASRFLNKVDESVSITQVCQDSNNLALVIIDFSLVGVFLFDPVLHILSVDGDTSYETNGIVAPLAVGNFRNPDIPINTHCQVFNGQLVYDFGKVIPDFVSAQTIEFELTMVGSTPQSFGVSFPAQSPSDTFTWTKGVLPSPISFSYLNGKIQAVFEYRGQADCSCSIQCISPSGVTHDINFCPNERQTINIGTPLTNGDPTQILIQLQDSVGNVSEIRSQSIVTAIPEKPSVSVQSTPKRVEIAISRKSKNGVDLNNVEYQLLKYENSPTNLRVIKDWSARDWQFFVDTNVIPGMTYGYAVQYKGEFQDISELSEWTVVTI